LKHRSTNAVRFALSGVALATACLWGSQAWALGLGRLSVQSALGEALRAEIDVTSLTPEEASSLQLRIAPPEAYRNAGVEYNAVLPSAKVSIQRRPDGSSVVRISSDRAVLEPFVDVILEATWSSGRLVREYTMLFDPPGTATAAAPPAAVAAPVVISPAPSTATRPTPAPAPAPAPAAAAAPPAPAPRPKPPTPAPAPTTAAAPAPAPAGEATPDQVTVQPGDSLSRIARSLQRPSVSLDQMLVALFRGNPQAFIESNMNRLKSGAVLSVPSVEQAEQIARGEAREIIQAQAADFNAYRQRLASGAAPLVGAAPTRQATGQVQAKVDDRKTSTAAAPDKLTLSQGGVKASAPEAAVSKETERKDSSTRLAELSRNVEELKRLQGATGPVAGTAPAPAPAGVPAAVAPLPPPPVTAASAPARPAPAAASRPAVAPKPNPKPAPATTAAAEPDLVDSLLDNPLILPGAGVLVALLAGLGLYRWRSRNRQPDGETSFLESRLQPDSFFGASGGQRIDTREAAASSTSSSSSSMNYSLSQLDAIGDVDPVAEADVYLAYGRDLQAEEILKEAMRASPDRMAIRTKLLEVYAKRRDGKAFELLATQVYSLTRGTGEDWEKAQELGRQIDPDNRLYQPGATPDLPTDAAGRVVEVLDATTVAHAAKPAPAQFTPDDDATLPPDVDLDLDVGAAASPSTFPPSANEVTQPLPAVAETSDGDSLTFELPDLPAAEPATAASDFGTENLDFDLGDLPLDATATEAPEFLATDTLPPDITAAPAGGDSGLDFGDFGSSTLDAGVTMPAEIAEEGDPLARKLELAEEFRQIGDVEGARDLLEEVLAKADGALRNKAQGMLDSLG
jgi:pilus assembly protein FimV